MNIVDSSGWLEYFADSAYAKYFANVIENCRNLLIPSIVVYEVYKKILSGKSEQEAVRLVAYMRLGLIVDLDLEMSLFAAKLSREHKLPMADSIILATAEIYDATIWTQDADFKKFKRVKYFKKESS